MAERMADVQEDPPAGEDDNDSDGDEEDRLFVWMVNNDNPDEDEEDEEEEVEEEQLETEGSETFELDAPAERSGHVAVVDGNVMYVWGGYKVRPAVQFSLNLQPFKKIPLKQSYVFCLCKNAQTHGFFDLYLPRNEIWTYNMESGVW